MEEKEVSTARIKVICFEELEVGDLILWTNKKCKVVRKIKNENYVGRTAIDIETVPDDKDSVMGLPKYTFFYKIMSCRERNEKPIEEKKDIDNVEKSIDLKKGCNLDDF